ncbi:MAG TPA: LuxR C-terminal-related transcriptional regulator [bacterium]|nr:LuxR C-terminal-related transcriptional regulator [bacterium]
MRTSGEEKRLIDNILRASFEAVSVEDLGKDVLPLLDRLFDTSTSLVFRYDETGKLTPISGKLCEANRIYVAHFYSDDPLQRALHRKPPRVLRMSDVPEWKEYYFRHPAHRECTTRYEMDYFVHLSASENTSPEPGMIGIVLARNHRQPDFKNRELKTMATFLPALGALVRRSERLDKQLRLQSFLDSMLESNPRPKIALDLRGALLWASERAAALVHLNPNAPDPVPGLLAEGARRLGALVGERPVSLFPFSSVAIPRKDRSLIRAELRLTRSRRGDYFVVAELEDPEISPPLAEAATRHRLTSAETQVLNLIALGLSNKEISQRLFVSMPTVCSHVAHILKKLGIHSRSQAVLIANGLKPDPGADII